MASLRALGPFQPRTAGPAPSWRDDTAPAAIAVSVGVLAVGVGVLAGISPQLAIAAALGLGFAALVVANITVGLCLFTVVSFLDVLSNIGGSVGLTKVIGLLLVMSWLATVSTRQGGGNDFVGAHPTMTYLLAMFVAWSTVSFVWAESPGTALSVSFRYFQDLLLFLIVFTAVRERRHAVWLVAAFVGGATIAAVVALIYRPDPGQYDVARATGTIGDPNELAAVLVAGLLLAGALVVILKRSPALRVAATTAMLLCAAGLFVTFSRGGLIALGFAMVAGVFIAGRWRKVALGALVLVSLTAITYFAVLAPQASRDRVLKADGGTGRTDIWKVGSRMVSDHPVRGVGSGNFKISSIHYVLKPGSIKYDYFIDHPKVAHNMYLHILAELGVVGLLLFVSIIAFALLSALHAARRFAEAGDEDMDLLTRAAMLAVLGMLAADFFLSGQLSKQLWLLLGLGPAMLALSHTRAGRHKLGSY
jgi:O-antigen ligase